jgi:16S rRNA processing protein RimM
MGLSSRSAKPEPASDLITVGRVVAPHGIRGEVRVRVETDFPERFARMRSAYLVKAGRVEVIEVLSARPHANGILLTLGGIGDRTAAGALRGAEIAVSRADLTPLGTDAFYVFEIIGMRVRTQDGRVLGTVAQVMQGPANDVYVVTDGHHEVLVPALRQVVLQVDRVAREMTVALPAGLEG